ncbi:hypothetical protein LTR96_011323 [Exophiala xenobiotica]|nr:hypothetical protein LTR72_011103 [Exophiala xenobiotica]KAK5263256.1 hypothetical protein LTR96_011323 [Exophiala xenobiotica]KAK5284972.1 hypothetical protein LTR14_011339 [Exophiala xenobiotica]KAK5332925.1 hypothetical protein LTR98_010975 [Exophiala xenobiotica]KAK5471428.1 hypothetical protein LTR55_010846 [Exophiala xenobiotica]
MEGSEDSASIISSLASQLVSLAQRQILTPTPPSTRRSGNGSRSPSPIRKVMSLLERATPSIRFCQPGKAVTQPAEVVALRRFLVKDLGVQVLPSAFEDPLRAADPEGYEDIPKTMFDESRTDMTADLQDRWNQIEAIYSEAERCQH